MPSFSSFKPRPSSGVPATQAEGVKEDQKHSTRRARSERKERDHGRHESQRRRDTSRDQKRDRHPGLDHRERQAQAHRSDRERHHEHSRAATPWPTRSEFEESEYFMIDRRGDSKNVQFGGLHRYDVPHYHRAGCGRIVGADKHARIDREASTEKAIVLRFVRNGGKERAERLLTKKHAKSEGRSQRLVLPHTKGKEDELDLSRDLNLDFISLRPNLKRKRESESPVSNAQDVDYRSIEGKAKPDQQPQDEDLEFESSSDGIEEGSVSDSQIRKHNAELARATKTSPADVDVWLALTEHQAKTTFPGLDSSAFTSSQRRSVADIRLTVLDQGFKHVSKEDRAYDRMLLVYLVEGSKIWETPKLSEKWKRALRECPGSLILWKEYLGHVQADQTAFSYERVKDYYLDCLKTLNDVHRQSKPDEANKVLESTIYVLLRFATFTKDSGYDELAVAIWQAVFEYYFFAPSTLDDQMKLQAFEEFWESDKARIGEEGAQGWRAWASDGSSAQRKSYGQIPASLTRERPFTSFAVAENAMTSTLSLPAGTGDEEDESEDPFRYVMFSDVKPVLERLPGQLDLLPLVNAFLFFMHLPTEDEGIAYTHGWPSDPCLSDLSGSKGSAPSSAHDSFELFHSAFSKCCIGPDAGDFVHRTLAAIVTVFPEYESIGEYLLAFLSRSSPPNTAKVAKRLLKRQPTSLRYYNAYALAEAGTTAYDHMDKATQIWTKALEFSSGLSDDARDDVALLWHGWTMTLIHRGDDEGALRILFAMPDGSATALSNSSAFSSSGAVLKARRRLEEGMDRMILKRRAKHTALYADCLAWLLYLSGNNDSAAAFQSYAATSVRLQKEDSKHALELLHQGKARLINRHMTAKRPFKPTVFRDEIMQSRRLFPKNGMILRQYHEVARLTRLDDRLRNAFNEAGHAAPTSQGLTSWALAIEAEIDRCSIDGASATKDSVRALFRRALLTPDSKISASPLLWKKWFDFESRSFSALPDKDSTQRQDAVRRAKQVFFDGLRFLPWHKGWAVAGMSVFAEGGDMTEEELRQIHDVLLQREIRLRVNVDEVQGGST